MNAQEMFKRFGYKLSVDNGSIIEYKLNDLRIEFRIKEKEFICYEVWRNDRFIVIQVPSVHEAITQQMKELGWIK